MDEDSIKSYITNTFESVDYVESEGNYFYFYNPDSLQDYKFPFATLMTNDINDQASNLDRPSVYRLNIGVSRETYESLFAPSPDAKGIEGAGYDFTALDVLMPHPVYASQFWLCVLNPGSATLEAVKEFLVEAYQKAVDRHIRRKSAGKSE